MKNRYYFLVLITIIFLIPAFSAAQSFDQGMSQSANRADSLAPVSTDVEMISREQRAVLAMTNKNYPVTPGDVYSVSYIQAGQIVQFNGIVNNDYSVNLGFFGPVDGTGKLFSELKKDITEKIEWAFPKSYPDVNIVSTGVFEVYLTGEVKISKHIQAWGLTRLSDIALGNATDNTSYREIYVKNENSSDEKSFDLYKAWYEGGLKNDPILTPGSTVRFIQFDRSVSISGEVKRPGNYQLLEGENLSDLINLYANGFTDKAYKKNIILQHLTSELTPSGGQTEYLDYNQSPEALLLNYDTVSVQSREVFLPIMYIEGAVGFSSQEGDIDLEASNTMPISFRPLTKLSTFLLTHKSIFSELSNLEKSYYVSHESGLLVPIDLESIIYEYNLSEDRVLQAGDRIIVPFKQKFVTVSGAVNNPGRYPYIPNKTYSYYINLAGGFDVLQNNGGAVKIFDPKNERVKLDEIINEEYVINASKNSVPYILKEYSPLITALASVSGIIISIVALTQ